MDHQLDRNPTVKEILLDFLKLNGFSGLLNEDGECGCDLDDLMVCSECPLDCEAGYKVAADESSDYIYMVQRKKP